MDRSKWMARRKSRQQQSAIVGQGTRAQGVERALWPFAAFGTFVAAVVGAVTAWDSIADKLADRPVLVGSLLAFGSLLLCLAALQACSSRLSTAILWTLRLFVLIVIAIGYWALIVRPNPCAFVRDCGPSDFEPFPAIAELLVTPAHAAEPSLIIVGVAVDESRSSFRTKRDSESIHGQKDARVRLSFQFDRNMISVFSAASCIGVDGERPIIDALPIWQHILRERGKADLARSLESYAGYRTLIRQGGRDAFRNARPNVSELTELKRSNPPAFALMQRWMVKCVGVQDLVLVWTLENRSRKPVTVVAVDYDVLDVGKVKGGNDVVLTPVDVQPHEIAYATGRQNRILSPQIIVPPEGSVALRIAYRLQTEEPGLTWLIRPSFRALKGVAAVGPEFKLFAAK